MPVGTPGPQPGSAAPHPACPAGLVGGGSRSRQGRGITTLQAFSRLSGRSREVLALRYYLDLTDAEIAEALGVSKSTVSSTASRALSTLAAEIKEDR